MRFLLPFIFLLSVSASAQQVFRYGGANANVYVSGSLIFPNYATSDTNMVLGANASGAIILRTKGSGSSTDTTSLSNRINQKLNAADSSTPNVVSSKYVTENRLTHGGLEMHNEIFMYDPVTGDFRGRWNKDGLFATNVAGDMGTELGYEGFTFNTPTGYAHFHARNLPLGETNWYFQSKDMTAADSADLAGLQIAAYDSFAAIRADFPTGGGGADSSVFTTIHRDDTGKQALYSALSDTADAIRTYANSTFLTTETDPVANAKTVTIGTDYGLLGGGAAQALSANPSRTLSVDTGAISTKAYRQKAVDSLMVIINTKPTAQSWTIGSIPFAGATGTNTLTQNNSNLYWDNTNNRMALGGTTSPAATLDVRGVTNQNVPMLSMLQTWSGSVVHTGMRINTSGTGNTGSLLADFQASNISRFTIGSDGWGKAQTALSAPFLMSSTSGSTFTASLKVMALQGNWGSSGSDLISMFWDRNGAASQTTITGSSGLIRALGIYPRVNQSGSASMTDLYLNRVQVAVGSGDQYLVQAAVSGVDKWRVTNTGLTYQAGTMLIGSTVDDGVHALQVTGSAITNGIHVNTSVMQGSGIKHVRQTTGSVTASSSALITITWASAFADANYTVVASVLDATTSTSALSVTHIESQSASAITVRVANTSGGDLTGTLHVIAMHD